MLIQGVVISFNPNTKVNKVNGGSYDAWELVYRDAEGKVTTEARPATGLKFNPALRASLQSLAPNDAFTMVKEKEGQYWNVKSVSKGHSDVQDSSVGMASAPAADGNRAAPAAARSGKVTGSNYETPEERAKRQVIIVRQSSIGYAIQSVGSLDQQAAEEGYAEKVLNLAKEYEKHVYKDLEKVAKKYMEVTLDKGE